MSFDPEKYSKNKEQKKSSGFDPNKYRVKKKSTSEPSGESGQPPSTSIPKYLDPNTLPQRPDEQALEQATGGIVNEFKRGEELAENRPEKNPYLEMSREDAEFFRDLEQDISSEYREKISEMTPKIRSLATEIESGKEAFANKYKPYFRSPSGKYEVPPALLPEFQKDAQALEQLSEQGQEMSKDYADAIDIYKGSAKQLAYSRDALKDKGGLLSSLFTGLTSSGVSKTFAGGSKLLLDISPLGSPGMRDAFAGEIDKLSDDLEKTLYQSISSKYGGATPEFVEERQDEFWVPAFYGLGESIVPMVVAAMTGGSGTAAFLPQSYEMADQAVSNIDGLTPEEKQAYRVGITGSVAMLESLGFRNLIKNQSLTKNVIGKALGRTSGIAGVSSQNFNTAFKKILLEEAKIASKTLRGAGRVAAGTAAEFETGALQSVAQNAIEQGINAAKGKDVFTPKTAGDIAMDGLRDGAMEAVGGGIISSALVPFTKAGPSAKDFAEAADFIEMTSLEGLQKVLDAEVLAGNISEQESVEIADKFGQYKSTLESLPEDVSDKSGAVALIQERNQLENKIKKTDKAFQKPLKNRVDEINETLASLQEGERAVETTEAETTKPDQVAEDIDISMDEISQLEQEIQESEQATQETETPTEPQRRRVSVYEMVGDKVVDTSSGKQGTIQLEGDAGRPVFISDDGTLAKELGSAEEISSAILEDFGLDVAVTDDFSDAVDLSKKGTPTEQLSGTEVSKLEREAEQASKEADAYIEMVEQEAIDRAESETEALTVNVDNREFMVVKDKGGKYKIFNESMQGEKSPEMRAKAEAAYESKAAKVEGEVLSEAQQRISEARAQSQDIVDRVLDKMIQATKPSTGNLKASLVGVPQFMAHESFKVLKAAYGSGKSLANSIDSGLRFLEAKGYNVNKIEYKKYVLNQIKEDDASKTRQVREEGQETRQEGDQRVGDMQKQPETEKKEEVASLPEKDKKKRKSILADIGKKTKRIQQRLKKGDYNLNYVEIINLAVAAKSLNNVKDIALLEEVQSVLKDAASRRIPKFDIKQVTSLTKRVQDASNVTDSRSAIQRAKSSINSLTTRIKKNPPKDLAGLVSVQTTLQAAQNNLDDALANGEIDDSQYSDQVERLQSIESSLDQITPDTPNSYAALVRSKGNITRTQTRIKEALDKGEISQEKADELTEGLKEANERYKKDTKKVVDANNKRIKDFFKGKKSSSIKDDLNLPDPQGVVLDALFGVMQNESVYVNDPALSDQVAQALDAIENGFFPLRDIGNIYKKILSDQNSQELVTVMEKTTKSMKEKTEQEMARDFSSTYTAFKSSKFGKEVAESKVIERVVYGPLVKAVSQANQDTSKILDEYEADIKMTFFDKLNPAKKRKRRKNILLAGIYLNQLQGYLNPDEQISIFIDQKDPGTIGSAGTMDWLGIILGKDAALNAIDGEVSETTRSAIKNGELSRMYDGTGWMTKKGLRKSDLSFMEEIWEEMPKKEYGSVDWDEFFNNTDKYLDKEAQKIIVGTNAAYNKSYEYSKTAKIMRGQAIEEVLSYHKRARRILGGKDVDFGATEFSSNLRVVAKSSIDRVTNDVGAIDFNVINGVVTNAVEGPRFFRFELNGGVVNGALNEASRKSPYKTIMSGLKDEVRASMKFEYGAPNYTGAERLVKMLMSASYGTLLRYGRMASEIASMLVRMLAVTGDLRSPLYLTKTKTIKNLSEITGVDLTVSRSKEIETGYMSSLRSYSRKGLSVKKKNYLKNAYNTAQALPEIVLNGGFVYPMFLQNYKALTGEYFDSNYLSDPEYIERNKSILEEAASITKIEMGAIFPTGMRFLEIRKRKLVPFFKNSAFYVDADSAVGSIMGYMSSYAFKESEVGFMPARYASDIFRDNGFTRESMAKGFTQLFFSKETAKAAGVLLSGMTYAYSETLQYLFGKLGSDDREEREEARKQLSERYGIVTNSSGEVTDVDLQKNVEESFKTAADQLGFYFVGRYGQGIRIATILGLSAGIETMSRMGADKERIQGFADVLQRNFYTQPIAINEFSLKNFATEQIPAVNISVNAMAGVAQATMDAMDILSKAEDGKRLDEEEKAMLRAYDIMFKYTNAILILQGMQVPEARAIQRRIDEELKKKDKKRFTPIN